MNFLGRFLRSIVTILPSALPGLGLTYYGWRQRCYDIQCKSIIAVFFLTGVVLIIWSLIVLAVSLLESNSIAKVETWNRFRVNLLSITPTILIHAAIFGVMLFASVTMIVSNMDTSDYKETGSLYLIVTFAVPVYELTRIFARKKSIEPADNEDQPAEVKKGPLTPPTWKTYGGIYTQTILTFGIWYIIMLCLLRYKYLLTDQINNRSWDNLPVLLIMAGISFLLLKLFKQTEKYLRRRGIISWNSSYY